jgi:hypothetical protein
MKRRDFITGAALSGMGLPLVSSVAFGSCKGNAASKVTPEKADMFSQGVCAYAHKVFVPMLTRCLCLYSQGACAYAHKVLVLMLTRCLCLCSQGVCAYAHKVLVPILTGSKIKKYKYEVSIN